MASFTVSSAPSMKVAPQRHASYARGPAVPRARVGKAAKSVAISGKVNATATAPKPSPSDSDDSSIPLLEPLPLQTTLSKAITGSRGRPTRNHWMSQDLQNNRNKEQRSWRHRKTKIVGTVGPSSDTRETLFPLLDAGMNVVRLNMSHGTHTSHKAVIDLVNEYNASGRRKDRVGLLLDTKGPEVRSGDLKEKVHLETGQKFTFTIDESSMLGVDTSVDLKTTVNYDGFVDDVSVGDVLLVDGGMLSLKVTGKTATDVECKVLDGGMMGSRRHLNVVGTSANLPAITDKDWEDLQFGVDNNVDFFALSFVRDEKVINDVKVWLRQRNAEISVLPKIESVDAVKNLDAILAVSDGAMVARGDLGAELPVEEVPLIQSEIVHKCNKMGKPVIVATNMLESMIVNPTPTRAEVADITVAVREGADAVMLSGETANGKYPQKAFEVMCTTAQRVPWELSQAPTTPVGNNTSDAFSGSAAFRAVPDLRKMAESEGADVRELQTHLVAYNATMIANTMKVPIVVFSRSGFMPALLAHFRPRCSIYAFTNNDKVHARMSLYRGVKAIKLDFSPSSQETEDRALEELVSNGMVKRGKQVCILHVGINQIWRSATSQSINFRTIS